jgi:hypothetical protein
MDYKLCKKLKDAGFPGSDTWKDYGDFWAPNIGKGQEVVPTLSELIEACGEKIHGLGKYNKGVYSEGWWAFGLMNDLHSYTSEAEGETPEEAVAKLYLAIHSQELKDSKDMID